MRLLALSASLVGTAARLSMSISSSKNDLDDYTDFNSTNNYNNSTDDGNYNDDFSEPQVVMGSASFIAFMVAGALVALCAIGSAAAVALRYFSQQ